MSGDVHVRFCEGLGVRFPRVTYLVILVDSHPRQRWLRRAEKKIRRHLARARQEKAAKRPSIPDLLVNDVEQRLAFQIAPEVLHEQASCAGFEIKCVVGRVG